MWRQGAVMCVVLCIVVSVLSCQRDRSVAEPQRVVDVRVVTTHGGQQLQHMQTLAEEFNNTNEGINLIIADFPDVPQELLERYNQYVQSQDPSIDVLSIDVIWPGDLAEHLIDLQDYFTADEINDHFPSAIQNNTVDGRLVAMPWYLDSGLFYFRSDLLEQYNREVPRTWDEMESTARFIQEQERAAGNENFWGFIWQAGMGEGLTCFALEVIASHGGGSIVNADGQLDVYNPRAIAGLERARDWIGDITPEYALGFQGAEGPRSVWETGDFLFMRNWPYAFNLGNRSDSAVAGKFDITLLPSQPDAEPASALGGFQLGVSRYSQNPAAAAEVVRFFTSHEAQLQRALTQGDFPTHQGLYQDDRLLQSGNPMYQSLGDVFAYTVPRPSTATAPYYNEFSRDFYTLVHQVLSGEMAADLALQQVRLPEYGAAR